MKNARPCFLIELLRKRGIRGEKASSLANRRQSRNGRVSLGKRSKKFFLFGTELVSLPLVYGFAGGRSLFQFDRSTLKRLAIARAMSSCTSKMSFSSRSYRSDQRW